MSKETLKNQNLLVSKDSKKKMQKYREITVCRAHAVHMQRSFENLKRTSTKKRCDFECE